MGTIRAGSTGRPAAVSAWTYPCERRRAVPGDVAVVGFDDIEEGRYSTPTLTTVRPDKERIARLAVDLMCRDAAGLSVAVEIKRRGDIDGVEQLTRYLELLNRDPLLNAKGAVRGIFAAQEIKPQARVLAEDRGITCATVDYDALRGLDDPSHRLF